MPIKISKTYLTAEDLERERLEAQKFDFSWPPKPWYRRLPRETGERIYWALIWCVTFFHEQWRGMLLGGIATALLILGLVHHG